MKSAKKIIFTLFVALIMMLTSLSTVNVDAAIEKFIINGSMEYTIIDGEKLYLYVNTSKTTKWSSSNPKIASVTKKGVVTGKKPGKVTITAKVGKKKYTCKVFVLDGNELREQSEGLGGTVIERELTPDTDISASIEANEKEKAQKDKEEEEARNKRIQDILENGSAVSDGN